MQRSTVLYALLFVLITSMAWAGECCKSDSVTKADPTKPAIVSETTTGLPVYKNASPTMEVNVGTEDILPAFQTAVPLAARLVGKSLDEKDSAEIVKALENVTHLAAIQWDLPASKGTDTAIVRFLIDKRPTKDFTKVLSHSNKAIGIVQIYAKPGGESLYMFHIATVVESGVKIKRVEVARVEGRVEYIRLLPIIQKLLL